MPIMRISRAEWCAPSEWLALYPFNIYLFQSAGCLTVHFKNFTRVLTIKNQEDIVMTQGSDQIICEDVVERRHDHNTEIWSDICDGVVDQMKLLLSTPQHDNVC